MFPKLNEVIQSLIAFIHRIFKVYKTYHFLKEKYLLPKCNEIQKTFKKTPTTYF